MWQLAGSTRIQFFRYKSRQALIRSKFKRTSTNWALLLNISIIFFAWQLCRFYQLYDKIESNVSSLLLFFYFFYLAYNNTTDQPLFFDNNRSTRQLFVLLHVRQCLLLSRIFARDAFMSIVELDITKKSIILDRFLWFFAISADWRSVNKPHDYEKIRPS